MHDYQSFVCNKTYKEKRIYKNKIPLNLGQLGNTLEAASPYFVKSPPRPL